MAGKRINHNLRLIRQDYSYTVKEVADLFGIDTHTVLRWVREDGLMTIPQTRPYLIHSTKLHAFLSKRQAERKQPCGEDQMYCMKCRSPQGVGRGTLVVKPEPKFLRLGGKCEVCGTRMNRRVTLEKWNESHPLYQCIQPSVTPHNGETMSQRSCPVEKGEQLCLNLTL